MRVHIRLHIDDRAALARLQALAALIPQRVRESAAATLREEAALLTPLLRAHVAQALQVRRKNFGSAIRAKVYDRKANRLPALWVGSRIPWLGTHEHGASIQGRMLVPLYGRVGRKRFRMQIDELMRAGNAYFIKNAKGTIVLMAENIKEQDRVLAGFKRRYRKAEGVRRLQRGADIPIAVLVRRVTLRRRLHVEPLVVQRIPAIAARLVRQLKVA